MKKWVLGLLLAVSNCACAASGPLPELAYRLVDYYDFESASQLSHWRMEEPGEVSIVDGRMLLVSEYQQPLQQRVPEDILAGDRGFSEESLRPYLLPLIKEKHPHELKDYKLGTPIRFSHFVLWNHNPLPDNFAIEYEIEPANWYPLHMLHFSTRGANGESIFADNIARRNGVASHYMHGGINTYRMSYFSRNRGTVNMRKAPGRNLAATAPDTSQLRAGNKHRVKLVMWQGNIHFYLDDTLILNTFDDKPLDGGYWGFRLMVMAKCYYDNVRLYAISAIERN